jgi:ABC-type uncharacterized transport system auxiliary subunit
MKKLPVLFCLALSACVTAGKRGGDAAMAVYDLGTPASRQGETVLPLAVEVRAPYWFDSLGIEYRLDYAEPGRLRDYSQARWVAPPAMLVQQRLVQQLGLVPQGQGGGKCLLRVDIDEFSQIFDTPDSSRGTLQARLALLDGGRNALAERTLKIDKSAPSQDSRGGVAALGETVDQLAGELGNWRGELLAGGRLKTCK